MPEKNKKINEKFDADHSEAELPGPVSTGSTKRSADKTQGDKTPNKLKTKNQMVSDIIAKSARMPKDALSDAHSKFVSVFDGGAKDNSSENMATITTKEDVEEIFAGTELNEESREKAFTLFETAVNARVIQEKARLEEEFENALDEAVEGRMEEVYSAIDDYLTHVAEQWVEDNQLAIESGIRSDVTESFLEGLHALFAEHHVNVPEDGTDVIESLTSKVEQLEQQYNSEVEARIEAQKALEEHKIEQLKEQAKADLVDSDKEKFDSLIEAVSYDSVDSFKKKLDVIKENYFNGSTTRKPKVDRDQLINEEIEEDDDKPVVYEEPQMRRYVDGLSRLLEN